ncbi:hypothetical protein D3C87_1067750 [compost metagenome]
MAETTAVIESGKADGDEFDTVEIGFEPRDIVGWRDQNAKADIVAFSGTDKEIGKRQHRLLISPSLQLFRFNHPGIVFHEAVAVPDFRHVDLLRRLQRRNRRAHP